MLTPADALERAQQWAAVADLGAAALPAMVIDLRRFERSFRTGDRDQQLIAALEVTPWVNVGVVDGDLDPVLAPVADACDVLIGDQTRSDAAVDVADVSAAIAELERAITASPEASVALVQLLRITHQSPVGQALHGESLTYALLQTGATFQRWLAGRPPRPTPSEGEIAVGVDRQGSLLRITLQRPGRRNALNIAMRDQLTEAFELVDLDRSIDGAILAGAGSNFCAGGDLGEFGSTPSPAVGHRVRTLRSLPALLHRVRDRVRAHVHGSCVGAGIELPAFSTSIIAHPNSTFRLPEIGFGLVPGAGGTVSVTRRCGRHRAAWLALTGAAIGAEQALAWHLIDRIDETPFAAADS